LLSLIQFFVDLCFLRRAPQDLPASVGLFGVVLATDLLIGVMLGVAAGIGVGSGLVQGLVDILFMLALLYGALLLVERAARFLQAATALLGTGAVLGTLALIPVSLAPVGEQTGQSSTAAWIFLMLVAWSVVVTGHILRHVFEIRLAQGAAIAVIYNLLAYVLARGLFSGA
jgi:hypothetical protein